VRFLAYAVFSVLAAVVTPASAQSVITAVTAEELASAVREAGTAFGVPIIAETRTSPDTSFAVLANVAFPGDSVSAPDTLRFFIGLDGCEDVRCGALSAVAFFSTDEDGPGTNDMNAWNATRRLTRAYVTPEGLALQSDYDLAGGVTVSSLGRFIRSFLISLVTFADALQTSGTPVEPEPTEPE
jgi:hypothetical protein